MAKLSRHEAERVLESGKGKQNFNDLANHLSSDLVVAVELLTENCITRIQEFIRGIQKQFGTDPIKCAVLGSESAQSAAKEVEFFFSSKSPLQSPAYFNNCSCMVIKPHIITENYVGQIFDSVLSSGFEISAAEMFWLDRPSTEVLLCLDRSF